MRTGVETGAQGKAGLVSHSRSSLGIIVLSEAAETYLNQLGEDLVTGAVELWQLPPSLHQFWFFAYSEGVESRQRELDLANADADRYYMHAYNPRKELKAGTPIAELERIRAEIYSQNDRAGSTAA